MHFSQRKKNVFFLNESIQEIISLHSFIIEGEETKDHRKLNNFLKLNMHIDKIHLNELSMVVGWMNLT